jgi:acyl-CoA hydrolase
VLTLRASVNAAWHSSMEVGVRVEAEDPVTGTARHTSSAYLTMVAIDEQGRPSQVPRSRRNRRPCSAASGGAAAARHRLAEREQIIAERG